MSWTLAIPVLGKLIDKVLPDAEQKAKAHQELNTLALNGELDTLAKQAGVITAEAKGESWLQRSWRPFVMLTFTALVVCRWLGWTTPGLTEAVELKLLGIVQLGLGGYIASQRGGEGGQDGAKMVSRGPCEPLWSAGSHTRGVSLATGPKSGLTP